MQVRDVLEQKTKLKSDEIKQFLEARRNQIRRNIKMYRKLRGVSQAMIAEAVGYSRQKVVAVEQGLSEFTYPELELLSILLDVSITDLVSPELHIEADESYRIPIRANSVDDPND